MAEEIQKLAKKNFSGEIDIEMKRADKIADLIVNFNLNDQGKELANIQNSQGFQEVWDESGSEVTRFRLDRKKE